MAPNRRVSLSAATQAREGASSPAPVQGSSALDSASERDRPRILLVEDDPDRVMLTMHALEAAEMDIEVEVASDGVQALDVLFQRGWQPDLIFLDLDLPRIDGFEVLARVRAQASARHLPIIVLSSSGNDEDIRASYKLGANSYIRKPVDYIEFRRSIRRASEYWLGLNEAAGPG